MPFRFPNNLILCCCASLLLAGCEQEQQVQARDTVRPVKTMLLEEAAGLVRSFPASIEASRRVELSFRVPGTLNSLQVQEGDSVSTGQVLATLDPTDYELAVQDAQARHTRARGDWERAKALITDGHISRTDYDRYEAEFLRADANLEQARLDLSYTSLRAPIEGTIARRFIQNFEDVAAGVDVFSLRDNSELEVRLSVPENIMRLLALDPSGDPEAALHVSFPAHSDAQFPLRAKEIATRADPATQTFEARLTFEAPAQLNVLPGMSAVVTADLDFLKAENLHVMLPASALDSRSDTPLLWVYQPDEGKARPVNVEVGPVLGGQVEILGGVELGDHIIVAGTNQLDESMSLYEMPKVEQAGYGGE